MFDGAVDESDAHRAPRFPRQIFPIDLRSYAIEVFNQRSEIKIIAFCLGLGQTPRRILAANRFDGVIGPSPIRDHTDPEVRGDDWIEHAEGAYAIETVKYGAVTEMEPVRGEFEKLLDVHA